MFRDAIADFYSGGPVFNTDVQVKAERELSGRAASPVAFREVHDSGARRRSAGPASSEMDGSRPNQGHSVGAGDAFGDAKSFAPRAIEFRQYRRRPQY